MTELFVEVCYGDHLQTFTVNGDLEGALLSALTFIANESREPQEFKVMRDAGRYRNPVIPHTVIGWAAAETWQRGKGIDDYTLRFVASGIARMVSD